MGQYHQLTLEEREKFWVWRREGVSFREIGRRLGRDHTTLSRDRKRNAPFGQTYLPCRANKRAKKRAIKQRTHAPLKGVLVFLYVREHLRPPYSWSPEVIAGRLSLDHPGSHITPETIYSYIYGKKQKRMRLWKYLRLHRKKRMKADGRKVRGNNRIVGAIPIEKRPEAATQRKEPGHWETDNLEGKKSDRTGISVSVDRVSHITRLRKLKDHTAATKTRAIKGHLTADGAKTLTIDRGSENTKLVTGLALLVYTCNAYHSWEKGTVENTVGRVRWYIPKGMSVDGITQKDLNAIEKHMNTTPRKILGFLTPEEFVQKIPSSSSNP